LYYNKADMHRVVALLPCENKHSSWCVDNSVTVHSTMSTTVQKE
jgi:hypothetical protein